MSAARKKRRPQDRRRADLARIHIAQKWASGAFGMSEDDYRSLVGDVAREVEDAMPFAEPPSSRYLSAVGRRELLRRFAGLGWPDATRSEKEATTPTSPAVPRVVGQTNGRYPVSGADERITQRQADYVAHLEDLLGWTDEPARLTGWLSRQLERRLTFLAALTRHEATVVITGLEVLAGIKKSGKKSHGHRWGKDARKTKRTS